MVAGCVLAGMRGGEDTDALWAMGLADYEPWELNAAALRLLSGLLHSTANTWGLDPYEVAQRWALTLADDPNRDVGSCPVFVQRNWVGIGSDGGASGGLGRSSRLIVGCLLGSFTPPYQEVHRGLLERVDLLRCRV